MGLVVSVRAADWLRRWRDDQGDIGLRKVAVDFVHLNQSVVGNIGSASMHVHVARAMRSQRGGWQSAHRRRVLVSAS